MHLEPRNQESGGWLSAMGQLPGPQHSGILPLCIMYYYYVWVSTLHTACALVILVPTYLQFIKYTDFFLMRSLKSELSLEALFSNYDVIILISVG